MSVRSNIDLETLKWVQGEVAVNLQRSLELLDAYQASADKGQLSRLITSLHQVVGSLQMLELKSMSALMLESEQLIEHYNRAESSVSQESLITLVESSIKVLSHSLDSLVAGGPELLVDIAELINQMRAVQGAQGVEISSLFAPSIEVFPDQIKHTPLSDEDYMQQAAVLRRQYQMALLL